MNRLNAYLKKNPDAGYAHFLRGYQHGFLGHPKSALRDLNRAVELESRDQLAVQLIERFGGKPPAIILKAAEPVEVKATEAEDKAEVVEAESEAESEAEDGSAR